MQEKTRLKVNLGFGRMGGMNDSTPELADFARRFNALCDEKRVSPKFSGRHEELAKLFDVSRSATRKWCEGEGWPQWEQIIRICQLGGVRLDWLLRGRGPKHETEPDAADENPRIQAVLAALQGMDTARQDLAARLVAEVARGAGHDGGGPAGKP